MTKYAREQQAKYEVRFKELEAERVERERKAQEDIDNGIMYLQYSHKGYYSVSINRQNWHLYDTSFAVGQEFNVGPLSGSVMSYRLKVLEIIRAGSSEIIAKCEIVKDYELPREYFLLSENTAPHCSTHIAWYHTEEEALAAVKEKELKYYHIAKAGWNSYGQLILHDVKFEEEL